MSDTATLVDDDRATVVHASRDDDTLLVEADDLTRATGWTLKPAGLCRDDVCVPVRDRGALARESGIDLRVFATALGRPLALEPAAAMAVLGERPDRGGAQPSLTAPPFTLPDLDGNPVALADFAGRKRLLIAWASW